MEDEIKLLNTKLDYFEGNLLSAKTKIKTLDRKNKALEYQLNQEKTEIKSLRNENLKCENNRFKSDFGCLRSEKIAIENLQNRILQLENEKTDWYQYQQEMTNKVKNLTEENQSFGNALETCRSKQKLACEKNDLNLRAKSEDSDEDSDESSPNRREVILIVIIIVITTYVIRNFAALKLCFF